MKITSIDNPKLKLIKKLLENNAFRKKSPYFVLETLNPINEVLIKKPELIQYLLYSDDKILINIKAKNLKIEKYEVSPNILKALSSLKTTPGIMALVKKPIYEIEKILPKVKNIVILDGVSKPSNFGAIIRNAVAYKMDAVLYTIGSVEPYHPEAIRAMAGNFVQIPIMEISNQDIILIGKEKFNFFCLNANNGIPLKKAEFGTRNVFIFGAESKGITNQELINKASNIKIEMSDKIESLNVAVSSGILFYMFQHVKKGES
jgi:TrmH family RNA methyltransferase